jgi:hypothetical protein
METFLFFFLLYHQKLSWVQILGEPFAPPHLCGYTQKNGSRAPDQCWSNKTPGHPPSLSFKNEKKKFQNVCARCDTRWWDVHSCTGTYQTRPGALVATGGFQVPSNRGEGGLFLLYLFKNMTKHICLTHQQGPIFS